MDERQELLATDWGRHEVQIERIANVFGLTVKEADELVLRGGLDNVYGKVHSRVEDWVRLPVSRVFIGIVCQALLGINKGVYGSRVQDGYFRLEVGFPGQRVTIRKIPTMEKGAHEVYIPTNELSAFAGEASGHVKDERVLGEFARFLRRWGIDEIPQLLDVAEGIISLFGPRGLTDRELNVLETLKVCREDRELAEKAEGFLELLDRYEAVIDVAKPDEALVSPLSSAGSKDLNIYSRLYADVLLMYMLARKDSVAKRLLWNTFWTRLFGKGAR